MGILVDGYLSELECKAIYVHFAVPFIHFSMPPLCDMS